MIKISIYIVAIELHLIEQIRRVLLMIRNAVNFGVDNRLSSHTDNYKNDALVLDEGHTDDINPSVGTVQKNFNTNFSK